MDRLPRVLPSIWRTLGGQCGTSSQRAFSRNSSSHPSLYCGQLTILQVPSRKRSEFLCRQFLHTETQEGDDGQVEQQPVPHFANVLDHLRQLSGIFASSTADHADFTSVLNQLASSEPFSGTLNSALRLAMESDADYLTKQRLRHLKLDTLRHRGSLVVHSNGAFLFPNLTQQRTLSPNFITQFISATILSVLDYRAKLSQESPELCSQMFGSFRSPAGQADLQRRNLKTSDCENITLVISRQSNFFLIELNESMVQGEVFFVLKKVIEFILNYKNPGAIPFGSLSTLPRTDATFACQLLNETGLGKLQEAQFLINLDHYTGELNRDKLAKQILVCNRENVGNRWFDKALQLIIVLNEAGDQIGTTGICYEKSLVSPESVVDLMHHAVDFMTQFKPIEVQPQVSPTDDNQLMIKLQKINLVAPGKREMITSATEDFAMKKYDALVDSLQLVRFDFTEYGHEWIESINCQPDAWMAIALGLALRNYAQLRQPSGSSTPRYRGLTAEMLDYFEEPTSEGALRLALESFTFYQQLSSKGYDIVNILRVYEGLIEQQEADALPGKSKDIFKSLLRHSVLQNASYPLMVAQRSIPLSTPYEGTVEVGGPAVSGGFSCCYQFHKNASIGLVLGHQEKTGTNGAEVLREFTQFLNHALGQMKRAIDV